MTIAKIFIEIISGAFTGYITNSLAIKMLFKNYGPFGGVIIKTKDDFIENISNFVENNLLNEETLKKRIYQKEFKEAIYQMVKYFFTESLENHYQDLIMEKVPGIKLSTETLLSYLKEKSPVYSREILELFLPELQLKEIISKEQFNHISQQIITGFSTHSREIKRIIQSSELNNKNINTLFNPDFTTILNKNLNSLFKEISDNSGYLYNLEYDLSNDLNLKQIIGEFIDRFKEKRLKDLLLDQSSLNKFKDTLIYTINSEKNSLIISSLPETPVSFIDKKMEKELIKIIKRKKNSIAIIMTQWLKKRELRVERIFHRIINETLEAESARSPWKTAIKRTAYKLYWKNSSTTPTTLFARVLEESIEDNLIDKKIYKHIFKELNNIQLKNLPLQQLLNNFLSTLDEDVLEEISNKKISHYIKVDNFNPQSIFIFKKTRQLSLNFILNKIKKEINHISEKKLEDLLTPGQLILYYEKLLALLKEKERFIKDELEEKVYQEIDELYLSELIDLKNIENHLIPLYEELYNWLIDQKIYKRIQPARIKLEDEGKFKEISAFLLDQINENLPDLSKNNLSTAIKNNLQSIPDNDIKNIIEDFVGHELKPISYFGALLGTITAFFLYLIQGNARIVPSLQLPLSILFYGFIGYITNVIAIKMIFRPYKKKKLWGITIPFTPGVISKEKERFAHSTGNFVAKELINESAIKKTFVEKRELMQKKLSEIIIKDNYHLPCKLLKGNIDKLASGFLNYLNKEREKNLDYLVTKLNNESFPANKILADYINKQLENYLINTIPNSSMYLFNLISKKDKLSSLLPDYIMGNINQILVTISKDRIDSFIEQLKVLQDKDKIAELLSKFYSKYQNITLQDLSSESQQLIKEALLFLCRSIISSNNREIERTINSIITDYLEDLISNIPQYKYKLKGIIFTEIKARMGLWSKAGKLVNFDETLEGFTDRFIDESLPELINIFLNEEKERLVAGLKLSPEEIEKLISILFANQKFRESFNVLITGFAEIPLSKFLDLPEKPNAYQITELFSREIEPLSKELIENLEKNKEKYFKEIDRIIPEIMDKYFYNKELNYLFSGIKEENIEEILKTFYKHLSSSKILKEILNELFSPEKLFDTRLLKEELGDTLTPLFDNPYTFIELKDLFSKLFTELAEKGPELIEKETIKYFIDFFITAILDTLEIALPELLKKIDVKEITISELNNMDSKEIEKLFYSFAGNYFNKLEIYGWAGSIIGLLNELIKGIL